jgi:hypothetical protein
MPKVSPRLVGVVAFVASGIFFVLDQTWLQVALKLLLAGTMIVLVARWSRREGWSAAHRLALAGGALLTYAWAGFVLTELLGRTGTIHLIGNVIFASGAVALLAAARRTVATARWSAPSGN